jgi:hypothetical protein
MYKFILLIFFMVISFAKTLVVDDDYGRLWGGSICEHGSQKVGWFFWGEGGIMIIQIIPFLKSRVGEMGWNLISLFTIQIEIILL